MIEVAFNNFGYTHLPEATPHADDGLPGLVRAARDLGFSCFQYNISGEQDPARFDAVDMDALLAALDECGVAMSLHHHAFDLLTLFHFAERDAYAEQFCDFTKAAVEFIHRTGGTLVTIHPPQINFTRANGYSEPATRGAAAEAYREALLDMGEHAEKLGMRIGVEAFCFDDPVPGGSCFRGMDELDAFLRSTDFPPSVGLQIDTTHYHHKGWDPCEAIRRWSDRVYDIHAGDCTVHEWVDAENYRAVTLSEVHLPVGEGTVDFEALVRTLVDVGYDEWLTHEIYPQHVSSTDDIVRSRERLERVIAETTPET